MYYNLISESGEYSGVTAIRDGSCTTTPVKPLRDNDKAIYDRETDTWQYCFEKVKVPQPETEFSLIRYYAASIYNDRIYPKNGDIVLKKSEDISVLIPCYGKAKYIADCVKSCVNQTMKPTHIIVLLMDNESIAMKDEIENLDSTVKCIVSERLNASAARTKLVNEHCPTDWFVLLDADDILMDNFIETLYKEESSIAYGAVQYMDDDGDISKYPDLIPTAKYKQGHFTSCICCNLTSLMHKDVFNAVGLDEDLCSGGEDYDFHLRVIQSGYKISFTRDTAYYYRQTNGLAHSAEFYRSHFKAVLKNLEFLHNEYVAANCYDPFEMKFYRNPTIETLYSMHGTDIRTIIHEKSDLLEYKKYESKQRTPITSYSEDGFVYLDADFELDDFVLANKTFDVLFLTTVETKTAFNDTTPMLINKSIIPEIEGKAGYELVTYLLDNYACFEWGYSDEIISDEELYERIKHSANQNEVLKEQIRILENVKKDFSYLDERKVTFVLRRECNMNCPYCNQGKEHFSAKTDDEFFENFDKALTYFEEKFGVITPQIIGGEPTLWSDEFCNRIIERLRNYKQFNVFSNGTNRDSIWYKHPKAFLITHVVDWVAHPEKLFKKNLMENECVIIVITHGEVDIFESYLKKYPEIRKVNPSPCMDSPDSSMDLTAEEVQRLEALCNEYRLIEKNDGFTYCHSNRFTEVDCDNMLGRYCCKYHSSVPFDEIQEDLSECIGCPMYTQRS